MDKVQQELFDVYGSLRRKEEGLRTIEDRLNGKLKEKEDQSSQLQSKVTNLE